GVRCQDWHGAVEVLLRCGCQRRALGVRSGRRGVRRGGGGRELPDQLPARQFGVRLRVAEARYVTSAPAGARSPFATKIPSRCGRPRPDGSESRRLTLVVAVRYDDAGRVVAA